MEDFATVLRTLLHRIRAIQARRLPGRWPATAALGDRDPTPGGIYRVRPTAWGVADPEESAPVRPAVAPPADGVGPCVRRGLELTVYGLPVPRGLPST